MLREVIFDTETTGLDPFSGDRILEIGCVEVLNRMPTGRTYHQYINPERDIPAVATKIHGINNEMIAKKPIFKEIADEFLSFLGTADLVAHNASFDFRFVNWELENCGKQTLDMSRMVDTLQIARTKFPGSPASLDALCKRFGIDNSNRTLHGALLDAKILAEVYLEITGGRQTGMNLSPEKKETQARKAKKDRSHRSFPASDEELAAHQKFVASLKNTIWLR